MPDDADGSDDPVAAAADGLAPDDPQPAIANDKVTAPMAMMIAEVFLMVGSTWIGAPTVPGQ